MRKFLLTFLGVLLLFTPAATPQSNDPQFGRDRNRDDAEVRREHDQQKRLNKERQAKIKIDTDRLLALATELKQYVDKTNENVLSVEVIRKTEEIEKLARDVREKVKADYSPPRM